MTTTAAAPAVARDARRQRGRALVWLTITWNSVEAVVALLAGAAASSSALLSFGLDATIELSAAVAALWYLRGVDDERDRHASRAIALSFWALAAWVSVEAVRDLVTGHRPDASVIGIVLTAISVAVMPVIARAKRRNGQALASAALVAESQQTKVCAYLSAAVLLGLTANAVAGWWWADPLAALVVAAIAAREGLEAWQGHLLDDDHCC